MKLAADLWVYCGWHIEEGFLDDQSSGRNPRRFAALGNASQDSGWNLQRSEIRSVTDLSRLWFILALATLYVTAQGLEVVQAGRRRWIDTHWFRGNSYFRIGLEWTKAAILNGWQLIQQVCFTSHRDPEPAMASRQQHNKKAGPLDFMLITVKFLPD